MRKERNSYHIIRSRYVTEKTSVLENLQHSTQNKCVSRCQSPKYVFLVDHRANKREITRAVEELYPSVTVKKVNTLNVKGKKRRVRGFRGFCSKAKKAVVTLKDGDAIEEKV